MKKSFQIEIVRNDEAPVTTQIDYTHTGLTGSALMRHIPANVPEIVSAMIEQSVSSNQGTKLTGKLDYQTEIFTWTLTPL